MIRPYYFYDDDEYSPSEPLIFLPPSSSFSWLVDPLFLHCAKQLRARRAHGDDHGDTNDRRATGRAAAAEVVLGCRKLSSI